MTAYNRRTHPTLRRGSRGNPVKQMQRQLAMHMEIDDDNFIDGMFGPNTEQSVRRFQKQTGLTTDGIVGEQTWRALLQDPSSRDAPRHQPGQTAQTTDRKLTGDSNGMNPAIVDRVKRCFRNKGYTFLDHNQPYELNIIGIRSSSVEINHFDDELLLIFRDESLTFKSYRFPITTDPGSRYTQQKLLNPEGAAILQPGQYDAYKIAKHRKAYDALCQHRGKVRVWRDANKDNKLDRSGRTYEGYFGINIHRAQSQGETTRVGPYSAGCQVFKRADDFAFLMDLAKRASQRHGNKFMYTLVEAGEI